MLDSRTPDRIAGALSYCALAGLAGYLAFVSRLGLDITDEGTYLLAARHPEDTVFGVTSMHFYAATLFRLAGRDVVFFRLAGLAFLLLSAAFLASGLARLAARLDAAREPARGLFVTIVCIGALLQYCWFLPSPSYNTLNAIVLNLALGFFFVSLDAASARPDGPSRSADLGAAAAVGASLGLVFFIKFPTAAAAIAALSVVYLAWPGLGRRRWRLLLCCWLGFSAWSIPHFVLFQGPSEWWRAFSEGLEASMRLDPGHSLGQSLSRYFWDLFELGKRAALLCGDLYLLLLGGAVALRLGWRSGRRPGASWVASGLVLAIGVGLWRAAARKLYMPTPHSLFNVPWLHVSLFGLVVFSALVLMACRDDSRRPSRRDLVAKGLLALTLCVAPIALSAGTNNRLSSHLTLFLSGWFGLYAWLFVTLRRLPAGRWVAAYCCVAMLGFASAQVVLGSWLLPYRLNGGLARQTVPTVVGSPETTLLLDAESSRFLGELRSILERNGFAPGSDAIGLYNTQGLIWAAGGRSLGLPWLGAGYPGSADFAYRALSRVPEERLRRAFVLQSVGVADEMPDLARLGLPFPHGYKLCGELPIPYPWTRNTVRIWKPVDRP